jgi:signal transduction histidine kinase
MAARFVNVDHDTPLLLPPDLRDWVGPDHMVHFVMDAVKALDLSGAQVNVRGTGSAQYPPSMMLGLLIYCYANGTFSSQRIETLTHENVAVRLLCTDTHPDHDTICKFRRENKELLGTAFHGVLELAAGVEVLKVGELTVAVDGTKLLANASKHSAMSHDHVEKQTILAQEQAQSADRMKTVFLSSVSHELRTPLNSISGFTAVLLKELSGPLNDEQRDQMFLVKSSSDHLVAVVNDILDLSKIEAGQIQLVAERFDLNAALRDWMRSLQPQFEAMGLTLRHELPNDPVAMTGDARRIGQIILNLLGNAVKFTATGHVEVSLEQNVDPAGGGAPKICVRITDTGPGIPPEHLTDIFDPFTRLVSEGRAPKQGNGLGLSISRKLAAQMGGTLTVASEVGHGSTFSLTLP